MNTMITGARRHFYSTPQLIAGKFHSQGAHTADPGILSTIELRRLVAQMID